MVTHHDPMANGRGMSLERYRSLISDLRGAGYIVVKYEEASLEQRHLIVRHDVDMCLRRALEMAKLEATLGVQSYYFVLVNTEFYNVSSRTGRSLLREIESLGHEIGLHFDSMEILEGDDETLNRAVAAECDLLQRYLARTIRVVTFHRPAKWLMTYDSPIGGRIHGYQPRFFQEMGYCSDSGGRFQYHTPMTHPAILAGRSLQLLTHPIWWCGTEDEKPIDKLLRFQRERERELGEELAFNSRPYAAMRLKS